MSWGVVCICSRGLVHSRCIEAVDNELMIHPKVWSRVFTHDLPIPEAQNSIVALAIDNHHPKWLWFVEEDVVVPSGVLQAMLDLEVDVVVSDYALRGGLRATRMQMDKVLFSGLGCTLIRSRVFSKLVKPYFRSDRTFDQNLRMSGGEEIPFGGQDISFFAQLKTSDIEIGLVNMECSHLKITELGEPDQNVGYHTIEPI